MGNNFVDGMFVKKSDQITVWEKDGRERVTKRYPAIYYFYVKDENGKYISEDGCKLKKLSFKNYKEFEAAKKQHRRKWESDVPPLDRFLMTKYHDIEMPLLNYTLLDIEVDYDKSIGFSSPKDPYAPINAITLFHVWKKEYVTYAVPPPAWKEAGKTIDDIEDDVRALSNITLFDTEKELLLFLLDSIEESDVISGWNSNFFDLPYIAKRLDMVLGPSATNRLCFPEARKPDYRMVERFGSEQLTVAIFGRQHLDYLDLFKKFTFGGRPSYALAAIADDELELPKLEYPGSLDDLYKDDFSFFVRYNIRDVEILEALDNKFKFVDLANEMSHANTVPISKSLGSVSIIDTGIINYCHNDHHTLVILKDKQQKAGTHIEGALVMTPRIGLHEWLGSTDINSLYPSTYRTLNISPEKLIGQFTNDGDDWIKIKNKSNELVAAEYERPELHGSAYDQKTGAEWYEYLKSKKWAVSAFGTIFDQNDQGYIPGILTMWYNTRKEHKREMAKWQDIIEDIEESTVKIVGDVEVLYKEAKTKAEFYDRKQLVYKTLLNSLYGATLNEFCRFHDPRLGASTTGTGRAITRHMTETAGDLLTGERIPVVRTIVTQKDGRVIPEYTSEHEYIIYGDTDSCSHDTVVKVNGSDMTIENAFCALRGNMQCNIESMKQMKWLDDTKYITPCYDGDKVIDKKMRAIYRHKVLNKKRYRVTLDSGKSVDVTGDHSIMVMRNDILVEVKPVDIINGDNIITI